MLVSARRISEELNKLKQKKSQLQERLLDQADINRAKVLLVNLHGWEESQAHAFLSQEAMKNRDSILKAAQDVLKNSKSR